MMKDLLLKYNTPGPRYTSYPPANFFNSSFSSEDYSKAVFASNSELPANISIYIHVPFCRRLCHFCGCNTGIAQAKDHIGRYMNAVVKEIDQVSKLIDKGRSVTQVHWGGGTPNSIPYEYIKAVMDKLHSVFRFHPDAEIAMECSPAYLSAEDVRNLALMGFNRLSLGVQDFHKEVLDAVNRLPSRIPVRELFGIIRNEGFKSINLDLMYGLPRQTPELFTESIQQAIELSPDRLVTFSYAHVPWFNKAMLKLEEMGLPGIEEKFALFGIAWDLLTSEGYDPIGLDHYAKPTDSLSIALREHKLHRNFQGYCTRETTGQVYAFGASGISQLWNSYSQNIKDYQKYISSIENSGLAVERGYKLNKEETICREAINSAMCNGYLDLNELAAAFEITVSELKQILKYSPDKFTEFINDGLVIIENDLLKISREGMLVVRNIAMALDPNLQVNQNTYSKTI
jgi:oxygen-independent coproporphyrinogen III oxidase